MKTIGTIGALCAGLLFSLSASAAEPSTDTPSPTGMMVNGVEWSVGSNEALPLVRGEKAAYVFFIKEGRLTLDIDGTAVSNIVGPSNLMVVGKELNLLTRYSAGTPSSGWVQRVSEFKLNASVLSTKQGLQPAIFPLARFDTPRSYAFTVEGAGDVSKLPAECKDPLTSYVRLIVDGTAIKEPGNPNADARLPRNGGYMGKGKTIDWAISGPQTCVFSVIFSLVDG